MKLKLWFARLFGIGMFLAVLSLVSAFSQGSSGDSKVRSWQPIGPWGGDIRDIKMRFTSDTVNAARSGIPDSVLVAAYGSGVFISDSIAGGYWSPRNTGLPSKKVTSLSIQNSGIGDTIYCGLDGYGVYVSTNGGWTWQKNHISDQIDNFTVNEVVVHPNQSWKAYAATNHGLYYTSNTGASWSQISDIGNNGVGSVVMHEYSTQKIYASTANSLYRSVDAGAHWSNLGNPFSGASITSLGLCFNANDTVFVGSSAGQVAEVTFPLGNYTTRLLLNGDYGSYAVNSITINPKVDTNIYSHGAFDVGGTKPDTLVNCGNDTLYIGTEGGVLKGVFTNFHNSINWSTSNTGLTNTAVNVVYHYRPIDRFFAASRIFYSGIHTWESIVFCGTRFDGLFKARPSNSGALSFTSKNDSLPVGGFSAVTAHPMSSDIVFVSTGLYGNGAIWKTSSGTNASPTWSRVFPSDTEATAGYSFNKLAASWDTTNIIYASDNVNGVYRTVNGGTRWTLIPNTSGSTVVYIKRPLNPRFINLQDTVFIGKQNGELMRSLDGGLTFSTMSNVFANPITCIVADSTSILANQVLYVTTYGGGVFKSTNNGSSFSSSLMTKGSFNKYVYSMVIDTTAQTLVVGTQAGVWKSADKGANWTDFNTSTAAEWDGSDEPVYALSAVRDSIWAGSASKGIFYNNFAGANWLNSRFEPVRVDSNYIRGIDATWDWGSASNPGASTFNSVEYAVTENSGTFRRRSMNLAAFTNGNSGTGSSGDSVYVWIPDTISALRGWNNYDIPVYVKNVSNIKQYRVTVVLPLKYFDVTVQRAAGTIVQTSGTLTDGRPPVIDSSVHETRALVFKDTLSASPLPAADGILFKIRVNVRDNIAWVLGDNCHNDSLPHLAAGIVPQTSLGRDTVGIAMLKGNTAINTYLDSTIFSKGTTSFTGASNTDIVNTKVGVPGLKADSLAEFWFRKYPGTNFNIGLGSVASQISYNGLPGVLATELSTAVLPATYPYGSPGDSNQVQYNKYNLFVEKPWVVNGNTASQMLVRVSSSAVITYPYMTYDRMPERPIRTGDAIGAFYYREDTLVCAGWGIWDPVGGCTIAVWGDDDRTPLKDGFIDGEQLNFKIYDSRYKKVWPVIGIHASSGKTTYGGSSITVLDTLRGKRLQDMIFQGGNGTADVMKPGWHLVSSYVNPILPGPELFRIFSNLSTKLYIIKDQDGYVYWPSLNNLDQIGTWDIKKAYWINMAQQASGNFFRGTTIDIATNSLTLKPGWNLMPYWGNVPQTPATVLGTLKFSIMRDDSGRVYWPAESINQFTYMWPSKGYEIYVTDTASVSFKFPASSIYTRMSGDNGSTVIAELSKSVSKSSHFGSAIVSPASQAFALKVNGMTLVDGDEVGIFNKAGVLVGSGTYYKNNNRLAASVYGRDELTSKEAIGAALNDELTFKIYSNTDKTEKAADVKSVKWVIGSVDGLKFVPGTAAKLELSVAGKVVPTEYAIEQNYPNPFNPSTTIRYALPVDGLVKIKIYDILGRQVKELVNVNQMAGSYQVEWNGTNSMGNQVATGVYMYRIEANNFKKTIKMMLMK